MILLYVLRAFFVLAALAIGWRLHEPGQPFAQQPTLALVGTIIVALLVLFFDVIFARKSLTAIAGLFFGLVAGLLLSYGLALVTDYVFSVFAPEPSSSLQTLIETIKVFLGIVVCYLCVSFVLQSKDDIRFVIPYVEFSKQIKGQRPMVLDTSVIIDGRIADITDTGIIDQKLVVPRFVLRELQAVADSNDRLKRNRGRRGLDILNRLQASEKIEIEILETPGMDGKPVDELILNLCQTLNGRVVTNDFNLNKVAKVRGVPVININDLANAMKPIALPGEAMRVKLIRPGEEPTQAVGYLEDGTMVVVEGGRSMIGEIVEIAVTSVLQTSAGRMVFGKIDGPPDRRRQPNRNEA